MAVEPTNLSERERRLDEILASYFEAAESGHAPAPEDLLKRFPDLAPELTDFFLDEKLFNRLSEPLQQAGPAPSTLAGISTPRPDKSGEPAIPVASAGLRSFGDYELLDEIGRGGMGVVYKARQRSLNRLVALKMVRSSQWGHETEIQRFRQEAEAAALLDHPHMVPIYEIGEQDGHHYFSMKLIEGGSLAARAASGQVVDSVLSQRRAARLLATVARAVHFAHQHGIIHRDLKPANILLDEHEQPYVADFGLAKRLDSSVATTLSGTIIGTPSYMAPEQASGKRKITTAADIYSLGAILYELLADRPPFRSEMPLETLRQVLEEEPARLRALNAAVDRDLETVCFKCLEKDPERRYGSAEALAEDLERWLAGDSIRARPVGNVERVRRWCRRNRALATLSASVVTLLVLVAVVSTVAAVLLFEQLLESYFAQAQARRYSGQPGRRFRSLELLAKVARRRPSLPVRNEAIACLALADIRGEMEWELTPPFDRNPDFDDRLERYAVGDAEGNVSVRRVADQQELVRLPSVGIQSVSHRFSSDGRFLAVTYREWFPKSKPGRFCVWDLNRPEIVVNRDIGALDARADFSPDSRLLAFAQESEPCVSLYDLGQGKEQKRLPADPSLKIISFSPEGTRLALARWNARGLQIHDLKSGTVNTLDQPAGVYEIAWRDDGKFLAAACVDHAVYVWDSAEPGRPRAILKGHQAQVVNLAFSHRGNLLTSYSYDGTTRLWNPLTDKHLLSTSSFLNVQFARPDDRLLGIGKEGPRIWLAEVNHGEECKSFSRPDRFAADISPDGRLLAITGAEGVRLWDLAWSREIALLKAGPCNALLFDQAGESLITGGPRGLERWPVKPVLEGGNGLVIGRPQTFCPGVGDVRNLRLGLDGSSLFVDVAKDRPLVLDLARQCRRCALKLKPANTNHNVCDYASVSPDGRWVATGSWDEPGARIWDCATGELVAHLPLKGKTSPAFSSPDGKWLFTSTGPEVRSWDTTSWQPGSVRLPREAHTDLPGGMVFARDGKVLAVQDSLTRVRLIDPETAKEYATLPTSGGPICFSADGSVLVTCGEDRTVQVWDLRLIRHGLAAMNLDWELPPYPPPQQRYGAEPLTAKVIHGNQVLEPGR